MVWEEKQRREATQGGSRTKEVAGSNKVMGTWRRPRKGGRRQ